jgi:FAD dependent oxidoreductase
VQAAYWRVRTAALRDTVHWSPTLDPEVLKLVTNDLVRESNVHTLMHCWVVTAITTGDRIEGVIFESKQGRFAVTAPIVLDCTGDGDVFAQAGAAFDDDFDSESAHAPTLEIPYRSLVPERLDGLLAAGRNLSADTRSHAALREIPECWAAGEAAGVAAVHAVSDSVELRDVDVARLQAQLEKQGAIVSRPEEPGRSSSATTSADAEFAESIHHRMVVDDKRAYE